MEDMCGGKSCLTLITATSELEFDGFKDESVVWGLCSVRACLYGNDGECPYALSLYEGEE